MNFKIIKKKDLPTGKFCHRGRPHAKWMQEMIKLQDDRVLVIESNERTQAHRIQASILGSMRQARRKAVGFSVTTRRVYENGKVLLYVWKEKIK